MCLTTWYVQMSSDRFDEPDAQSRNDSDKTAAGERLAEVAEADAGQGGATQI
jgi:hypothetical protein